MRVLLDEVQCRPQKEWGRGGTLGLLQWYSLCTQKVHVLLEEATNNYLIRPHRNHNKVIMSTGIWLPLEA